MPATEKQLNRVTTVARLMDGVEQPARDYLLQAATRLQLRTGELVFSKGDAGGSFYIVQSGRLEVSSISRMGRKVMLNQVFAGQCVGEIGMIDNQVRTASVAAIEPSYLLAVSRSAFMEAATRSPRLALNLMEILCERLRWVSNSVEEYAMYPLELRVARRLLVLHANFADAAGHIKITQNDLADFSGTTRESVNKLLMQWKGDGVIDVLRGRVRILRSESLAAIANSERPD